ncbi:DUF1990 domain-containing protein [Kribbella sp. NPDC051770]|uniref:DUF1990 family protein n=1 Tax=Kribbella sp. NPDC051770 TaxID=3155413 RepID=UPI0034350550
MMTLDDLAALRFSYDAVGSTRFDQTPDGYHRLDLRTRIGEGTKLFERAGDVVTTWQMHRAAGIRIWATDTPATIGTNCLGRLGPIPIPCRVVWTVADETQTGFAYGTLPGHPESGEESFLVTQEPDGVWFTLRSYSHPATWYTKLAGPLSRTTQQIFARRYTKAVQHLVA